MDGKMRLPVLEVIDRDCPMGVSMTGDGEEDIGSEPSGQFLRMRPNDFAQGIVVWE